MCENEKKNLNYEIRCDLCSSHIESKLLNLYDILEEWRVDLNLHFPEKDILIKGMIEWCSHITEEISADLDEAEADDNID